MDLTTLLTWAAGFGVLFLAAFAVFGFFVLRFIWRCFREVEQGHERFKQMGRSWRPPKSNLPSRSADIDRDYECGRGEFERRSNWSRAP